MRTYRVRGHNLADLAGYLFEPDKTRQHYLGMGYGEGFVANQARIFSQIIAGEADLEVVAEPDDICLGQCRRRETMGQQEGEIPCDDPRGAEIDAKAAGIMFLEIGKTYRFEDIERNLRNFYLDQHSI